MAIFPVILCGGSGTRLWPASRSNRPKQFLPLVGPRSSFQETVLRLDGLPDARPPVIVTGAAHVEMVKAQLAELGREAVILVEPEARDSAPAVAAAAAWVEATAPGSVLLMLAADHHIAEPHLFVAAATRAAAAAEKQAIVTFGVTPDTPATGFGYIRPGEQITEGVYRVAAFVEKPDVDTAKLYVTEGYLWNSGNFAFRSDTLLGEFSAFAPAVAEAAQAAVAHGRTENGALWLDAEAFAQAPKISLDYAVMEKTARAVVVPAAFGWSDLGAWDAIWEASEKDFRGNAVTGDVRLDACHNVLVRTSGPLVSLIGVDDIVVVVENDVVLVLKKDRAQAVKTTVEALKAEGRRLATHAD